ncbi:hypothetical protein [Acidovorax sp. SDU_ACID1]|uniref:hypothetical protein n=1 Tax=Acidovorax sp. SDU_ACID1 TaxID=3136632 RepID=UPI0038737A20
MTVSLDTDVTLTNPSYSFDFDVGEKSLDGTVIVDFDLSGLTGPKDHVGLANNRHGNAGTIPGATVGGTQEIWNEAAGVILGADGSIHLETWFRALDGLNEMTAVEVGSLRSYRKARIRHTTAGVDHVVKVYGIKELGGRNRRLLATVKFSTGANHDMRSTGFSPFVASSQPAVYRCIRMD